MYNNFFSRGRTKNSNLEKSSSFKTHLKPDVFLNHNYFRDVYHSTDLPQNISNREYKIYKSFRDELGRRFLGLKPAGLLMFEKRLKHFFISSKFLESFTNKKSNLNDERINLGSLDFYALSDKRYKNDILNSISREKVLSFSRNFALKPVKDIISQEFFRMKYLKKNAKRIAKILSKNNKNKNDTVEFKNEIDDFLEKDDDLEENEFATLELNKHLFEKRRQSQDLTKIQTEKNKELIFDNTLNINSIRNLIKHNSFTYKNRDALSKLQIFEYSKKDKPKANHNYWLNTSNINSSGNNEISSTLFSNKRKKYILTEHNKTKKKKKFNSRNTDSNFYKNKYTYINSSNENRIEKKSNLFLFDFQKIKKLSKKYKIGINNNINELDDYTKKCGSKLLNLLSRNNINKKIYIIKKEEQTELNELKDLLFNDKITSKKNKSTNNNNQSKDEKLNQKENQKKTESSKTIDFKSDNYFKSTQRKKINKKKINLELKNIIDNCHENQKKRVDINKIKEKCKKNYKLILKIKENIKYKKERLFEEMEKCKTN